MYNKQQFVEYLEETAKEHGISTFHPFPFLLEGKIKATNYRIFSYKQNDLIEGYGGTCACDLKEGSKSLKIKHIRATKTDTLLHTPISIVGFYAPSRGVITDQYSYVYMNFITKNKLIAGHNQKLMIGENMILKLPNVE